MLTKTGWYKAASIWKKLEASSMSNSGVTTHCNVNLRPSVFSLQKACKNLHEKPAFEERDNGGAKSKVL